MTAIPTLSNPELANDISECEQFILSLSDRRLAGIKSDELCRVLGRMQALRSDLNRVYDALVAERCFREDEAGDPWADNVVEYIGTGGTVHPLFADDAADEWQGRFGNGDDAA